MYSHTSTVITCFFGHCTFPGSVKPASNPNKIIKDQYYDHQLPEHQHKL